MGLNKSKICIFVLLLLTSFFLTACDDDYDYNVFGVNPVRVEITIGSSSRSYKALTYPESYGDDYVQRYDAYVCKLHSDESLKTDIIEDGFHYSCDDGQFKRYDYRVACTSDYSTDCNVDEADSNFNQDEYRNPLQVYQDVEQTRLNWRKDFENHTGRLDDKGEGEEFEPGLNYAELIADFNPDKDIRICMASTSCVSDWLNVTGVPTTGNEVTNYCCGDDMRDVGFVNMGHLIYVCNNQMASTRGLLLQDHQENLVLVD
jgi:hypothetical protein